MNSSGKLLFFSSFAKAAFSYTPLVSRQTILRTHPLWKLFPAKRLFSSLSLNTPSFHDPTNSFNSGPMKPALPKNLLNEFGQKLKEKLFQNINLAEGELTVDQDQREAFFRMVQYLQLQNVITEFTYSCFIYSRLAKLTFKVTKFCKN